MQASADQEWRVKRRKRLIDAARQVFAVRGFEQASMDEIAAAAGAGKPTLYRYFESKEALFEAVFVEALDDLERRFIAAEQASEDPTDALRRMLAAIVPMFREHVAPLRTMGDAASLADRSRRRILRGRSGKIEARLAGVLRRGREAGRFAHADDGLVARLIYGMVWSGSAGSAWSNDVVVEAILGMVDPSHREKTQRLVSRRRAANANRKDAGRFTEMAVPQSRGGLQ